MSHTGRMMQDNVESGLVLWEYSYTRAWLQPR